MPQFCHRLDSLPRDLGSLGVVSKTSENQSIEYNEEQNNSVRSQSEPSKDINGPPSDVVSSAGVGTKDFSRPNGAKRSAVITQYRGTVCQTSTAQAEKRATAGACPDSLPITIRSDMGPVSDASRYKEQETSLKRWMFSALYQHEGYLRNMSTVTGTCVSSSNLRILAIYETPGMQPSAEAPSIQPF
jgi:hypothetical protein